MILLVEDDSRLAAVIIEFLHGNGFHVVQEANGLRAAERIITEQPELVILDLLLPELSGLDVCRRVRTRYPGPVLMLTALEDELDEVTGLEVGADDYLTKPVSPRVLLARIQALLRRAPASASNSTTDTTVEYELMELGRLRIDRTTRTVRLDQQRLELTTAEFALLDYLARRAGQVVTREQIYRDLRGTEWDGADRSIDIHITRLRRKLGDSGKSPTVLKSVRGEGYLMAVR